MSRNRAAKAQKRMTQQVENTIQFNQEKPRAPRKIDLVPRTRNQEKLVLALQDENQHIVVTAGPAGTGKTYLAMLAAIRALKSGHCERLVLTRPAVGVEDERHGFLPGDLVSKMEPWTRPLFDVMREHYHTRDITGMLDNGVIEISPLAYMRGRTFKNAFIIADEMQNATPSQMKMLLTRLGENSRMVVTGDLNQADRPRENGLLEFCNLYGQGGDYRMIAMARFESKDVERHPVVKEILTIYKETNIE